MIKLKTAIGHHLGETYGPDCFYRRELHIILPHNELIYENVVDSFDNYVRYHRDEPIVKHHKDNYDGRFPIWVIAELITFSTINKYYKILNNRDRSIITKNWFDLPEYYLEKWIHPTTVLRNICAHYGYLFRRSSFSIRPQLSKQIKRSIGNFRKPFFLICMVLRELSEKSDWNEFIGKLKDKTQKDPSFNPLDYGLPESWEDYLS